MAWARGAKTRQADFMLRCWCEATGYSKASVIADCVIRKLTEHLRLNHGDRRRYEEARRRMLAMEGRPMLKVVK